jgi:fumarate reductase (CoM/CoB) subunit A
MFPVNTAPGEVTGDGYAMALRAGAQLVNMEFMQYMVRVLAGRPPDLGGPFWSLGPVIRDSAGEDVLRPALPAGVAAEDVYLERTLHYPFSSRDHSKWLDIAIQRAIRSGCGTARGAVVVDFSRVDPASARPARPQHRPPAPRVAIPDPLIEVTHAAHAINGGIRVDEWGQSTVPGLFAVGETIAGPHGADRLGGGMLAACNVYGARAGPRAAEYARGTGQAPMTAELVAGPLGRLHRFQPGARTSWRPARRALRARAAATLVALRSAAGLEAMHAEARRLRDALHGGPDILTPRTAVHALETENLLLVAEAMVGAALLRRESRGSHFREDYPERDDRRWLVNILWTLEGGELVPSLGRYRQDPSSPVPFERRPGPAAPAHATTGARED